MKRYLFILFFLLLGTVGLTQDTTVVAEMKILKVADEAYFMQIYNIDTAAYSGGKREVIDHIARTYLAFYPVVELDVFLDLLNRNLFIFEDVYIRQAEPESNEKNEPRRY